MADTGHALQWSGYGSLASVLEYQGPTYVQSVPRTPPSWGSPYSPASPSETASPVTPTASFVLYSPTAFHSTQLNSPKPSPYTDYCHSGPASPSLCSVTSSMPYGSPYASPHSPRTPVRSPSDLRKERNSRPGPLVPQKAYSAPFSAGNKPMQIDFRFAGGSLGVPMRLLQDVGAMDLPIEDAGATPFTESVATTITLRIWWPGYIQYSRRMTMRKATGLLMRYELAMAVSEVYKEFVEEAREDPKDRGQSKWRVGKGHITVNDLVLLRMFQVSQGSWQADVRLERER
ncbi:hypothetical protein CPB86DRAFT_294224 [Serendipita vermifera]|nr:hypothetical protein CPB86DRAFT_294224 [Serendipita vermifera]